MKTSFARHASIFLVRPSRALGRRYAHTPSAFKWDDPLNSASLFTEEELAVQETAHSYCQERLLPRVLGMNLDLSRQTSADSALY
jgi:glutaryl-CoA dehydrogenase